MNSTQANANLQPFSYLFRQSLGLVIHNFVKLIITSGLSSLLAVFILFAFLLPLGVFSAFVIDANSKADLTLSLLLLAIAFALAIFGFFYHLAFKFKSLVLVVAQGSGSFDAIGHSFLGSFRLALTNIFTFTLVFGGILLAFGLSLILVSFSKYFVLLTTPMLFVLTGLSFLVLLVPYASVLENKTGLSPLFIVINITKGRVLSTVGKILMFYFTMVVLAMLLIFLINEPFEFIGSLFARESFMRAVFTVYLPQLLSLLFALGTPLLNIAFLYSLYAALRNITPVSEETIAKKIKFPVIISSGVGFLLGYFFVLGLTTLSFFILKPRVLLNKILTTERVEKVINR